MESNHMDGPADNKKYIFKYKYQNGRESAILRNG